MPLPKLYSQAEITALVTTFCIRVLSGATLASILDATSPTGAYTGKSGSWSGRPHWGFVDTQQVAQSSLTAESQTIGPTVSRRRLKHCANF